MFGDGLKTYYVKLSLYLKPYPRSCFTVLSFHGIAFNNYKEFL